jgi:hypothetical protein
MRAAWKAYHGDMPKPLEVAAAAGLSADQMRNAYVNNRGRYLETVGPEVDGPLADRRLRLTAAGLAWRLVLGRKSATPRTPSSRVGTLCAWFAERKNAPATAQEAAAGAGLTVTAVGATFYGSSTRRYFAPAGLAGDGALVRLSAAGLVRAAKAVRPPESPAPAAGAPVPRKAPQ